MLLKTDSSGQQASFDAGIAEEAVREAREWVARERAAGTLVG